MVGIYKITNKINGHSYIGQSIDIKRRWRDHKSKWVNQNYPLQKAFKKYGMKNFSFEVLEECNVKELDEKEIYYINKFDTYNNGYNATTGGQGTPNGIIKISEKELNEIFDLLENSNLTQKEIAEIYNVGMDTISDINYGNSRYQIGRKYPIRDNYKKHYCIDCQKEINNGALRCPKCNSIFLRKVKNRPSKEELYQLLLNNSFVAVGKMFKVSDNAIRKWCKGYNIPYLASDYKKINKGHSIRHQGR